ncbi:MAG: DUF6491 family protein [Hyphomonadaceae bacterium]
MRLLTAIAALAAMTSAAFADPPPVQEEAAPAYNVLEADARLPFSSLLLRSYQVARDDSLILRIGADRWYRATVWQSCKNDLRWEQRIGFDTGPSQTLDRFSAVYVDGNRCPLESLDQIEEPDASIYR